MRHFSYLLFLLLLLPGMLSAAPQKKGSARVDSLRERLSHCKNDSEKIIVLNKLQRELRYSETPVAYGYAKEMLELAIKRNNKAQLASAYNDVSVICRQLGDYDKAISLGYKSLGLYEELKDTTDQAGCYLNLATFFKAKSDNRQALTNLNKALPIFQKVKNKRGISYCYNNIGTIYEDEHKDSLALPFLRKSLELKAELKDLMGMGTVYLNIGIVQQDLHQLDSAALNFAKAKVLCKNVNNLDGLSTLYINLGVLEQEKKNFKLAQVMLDSALLIAQKLNGVDLLEGSYKALYLLSEASGNSEKALGYFEQYLIFKDSTLNEASSKLVADMGARYDSEKKDKDIQLLTKQNEIGTVEDRKQRIFIAGLAAIIIGVVLLALLLYARYRFRRKVNGELSHVNHQINEQKKEITDSIQYARRIQESILLRPEKVKEILPQSFLLYRPKQIVSGDFYWVHQERNEIIVAVVDNVLHGVPGAFISLVGINLLNRAIQENVSRELSDMVRFIQEGIAQTLQQMQGTENYARNLQYAICRLNVNTRRMECISTGNPIYVINEKGPLILKRGEGSRPEVHQLTLETGDTVCLYTDGYADQLGGKDGKKFMMRNLEQLLIDASGKAMDEQKQLLDQTLNQWKAQYEQIDDILLIGFRI
jgi:serine phosphatase RsbU (regulator of sigma subunit)